jgi:hypothetical protein
VMVFACAIVSAVMGYGARLALKARA